jgi:ATP-dependent Clp protease ATP-binding subunit ClpB
LGFGESKETELGEKDMRQKVLMSLRENFKPEFLNRLDEVIIFHPIDKKILRLILDIEIKKMQKRLEEKDIKLTLTASAKKYLSEKGYDPAYGARPLKRVIQNQIMDELALEIIEGKIKEGDKIIVDIDNKDKVILKKK